MMGGRGELINAPGNLQDLRRRLYLKVKAEGSRRLAEAAEGRGGVPSGLFTATRYSGFPLDRSHNP